MKNWIVSVLLILFSSIGLFAQNNSADITTAEDIVSLPALRTIIDSAKMHSPLLHTKDIEIAIKKMEWRAQRWEWTDFIQPFTEYRYGTIDNVVIAPQTGAILAVNQSNAHRFNVGARINLTIFNAINSQAKLVQAEKSIELDEARRLEIEQQIAERIINLYNQALTYREIVFIKSNEIVTQEINLQNAKQSYEIGEVPAMELARITEIASKAKENHALAMKELRTALFLMIELVGRGDITTW